MSFWKKKNRLDRKFFTARFKRDYIAYSAILIFFFIVAAEIVLAIGIPGYLLKSDIWARQMQRQKMVQTFDSLRREANSNRAGGEAALQEVKLIGWALNMMADYLREERHVMPHSQVETLAGEFSTLGLFLGRLNNRGQAYNRERLLDTEAFVEQFSGRIAAYQPQEAKERKDGPGRTDQNH